MRPNPSVVRGDQGLLAENMRKMAADRNNRPAHHRAIATDPPSLGRRGGGQVDLAQPTLGILPAWGALSAFRAFSLFLVGLLWSGFSCHASAQSRLDAVRPIAWKRGAETSVEFFGDKLANAYPLVCYTRPMKHSEWQSKADGRRMKTSVQLADDFPIGWHSVRLCTPSGLTNIRTVYVSDLAATAESDLLHGRDAPQAVIAPALIEARFNRGDRIDSYSVELDEGQSMTVEVQALRVGVTMLDLKVRVFGPDRQLVAECDDGRVTHIDPYVRWTAVAAGTYRIDISESRFMSGGNYWYLLHLGDFPRPAIADPVGARWGTDTTVRWVNENGTAFEQDVTFAQGPSNVAAILPEQDGRMSVSPVRFRVNELQIVDEKEPNDEVAKANAFAFPAALHGVINTRADRDHYSFEGKKGQEVVIRTFAREPGRSPLDPIMNLKQGNGRYLASNDDANGKPDSMMRFRLPADDSYVLMLRDQRYRGGPTFAYRIEVTAPSPTLTLGSPNIARNQSAVLQVSQDNQMALLVTAQREDLSGPVTLEIPDLPHGVTAKTLPLPADRTRVPLLLSASSSAEAGGHLVTCNGVCRSGDTLVHDRMRLRQLLVNGRNNVEMWGVTLNRLAVAVVPAAPAKLELVPPKVPLTRTGTMQLQVRVRRDPSEEAPQPVTARMLYNPSGVSSRDRVTIPANASEAQLTLTANAQAGVGEWPIVLVADTNQRGQRFRFSSKIIPLVIADTFLDLAFSDHSLEQGTGLTYRVAATYKSEFPESARAELVGLPPGVTAEPIDFAYGDDPLEFSLRAADDARSGQHSGVRCRLTIMRDGEPITHLLGTGRLRVDKPLTVANHKANSNGNGTSHGSR